MLLPAAAKLQFTPSIAADIDADAEWELLDATTFAFAGTGSNTIVGYTGVAAQDLIPAIPSGKVARVHNFSIRNKSTTVTTGMLIAKWLTGPIIVEKANPVLLPKWHVEFKDGVWFVYDDKVAVLTGPTAGRFLRSTLLTTGTTFTTGADSESIRIRLVGGGGGGGGCTSVASAAAAGGGGGSGAYAEKVFDVLPNTGYAYAIGAAGTGVSGAAGNNGGSSTFAVGGTTVTAPGGGGAPVATAATTLTARAGGAGAAVATSGDVNSTGSPGIYGVTLIVATPIVASGKGADSQFGSGGLGLVAVGNGNPGTGFGAGGGGSATGASTVRTGGSGTAGCILVEEYT
jgi:hypothetical protein